jgi:NitT/TauT family transport system permease protein
MPAFRPSLMLLRRPQFSFNTKLSVWDGFMFVLVIGLLALIAFGGQETLKPLAAVNQSVSLEPWRLPGYALLTTLRMFAALIVSVLVTFIFGAWAAKSRRAEQIIIPFVDVMQSIPVLSFLSFTLSFFLSLFPGQALGAELAAVFAIFTSQAWNMVFSFYHSCRTVPKDLRDLSDSLRLGAWRRFWTLEAPYAAPGLVWNAMISMSGSWFFVVASEAFTVGPLNVSLPGVGSYVALAIDKHDLAAVGWAVLTMLVVILIYDQLLFRPLVAWSEKFRVDAAADEEGSHSWMLNFIRRSDLPQRAMRPIGAFTRSLASIRVGSPVTLPPRMAVTVNNKVSDILWYGVLMLAAAFTIWKTIVYVGAEVGWGELWTATVLGLITLLRVVVLVAIASVIWVPIGVWIGLRPKWAAAAQPVAQFLAAFPANLLFPLVVAGIVRFKLMPDIWLSPLMILGTQWYILFNVVAGASQFPHDLLEAADSLRVKGWTWWTKVVMPGIFPSYVTGAITAVGGSWNASILAEVANWGSTRVEAHGLGAYIADASTKGDLRREVVGVVVMAALVVVLNRLAWEPLFAWASRRLRT